MDSLALTKQGSCVLRCKGNNTAENHEGHDQLIVR